MRRRKSAVGFAVLLTSATLTVAPGYSWFTAGSYFGFTSGAAFSGFLAEPYGRVPLLGELRLLKAYPYALPGWVLLTCSIVSSIAIACLVPEVSSECVGLNKLF